MKCKREYCHREVTVDYQVYCSRDCAPYGYLSSYTHVNHRRMKTVETPKQRKHFSESKSKPLDPAWLKKWRAQNNDL